MGSASTNKIADGQSAAWATGSVEEWANESHRVAVDAVYRDVPADGDPPKLSEEYLDKSAVVIDQQLSKAGVRLAIILNRSLKS